MIRVVLAVVLSAAILGVSLPAIDDARADRTAARMDRAVDRVRDAAVTLLAEDPARTRSLAAGRTVRIHLPRRSWTASPVESLRIEGNGADRPATVCYDLPERRPVRYRIDTPLKTDGPIVLQGHGTHRLRLVLLLRQDRPVVLVRHA